MTKVLELKEKLEQGFYIDNLREMAGICYSLALESKSPASFFIIQKILLGIANYWDDGPVVVEEAKLVEDELKKTIMSLINDTEADESPQIIMEHANKAVSSYLFLFR